MIGDSIRAIIDLLKLRKDEKKLDLDIAKGPIEIEKVRLEVERLRREAAQKPPPSLVISPDHVSLDEIQRFDPRAAHIRSVAVNLFPHREEKREMRASPRQLSWLAVIAVVVMVAAALLYFWLGGA